jgi:hypothetical protein
MKKIVLLTMLLIVTPLLIFSEDGTPAGERDSQIRRGDYLTIKIALIGAGDELPFWWGHLALIIQDDIVGVSDFVDYGVFSYNQQHFIANFAWGRMWYTTGVNVTDRAVQWYKYSNRDVIFLTLNLSAEQKEELLRITEESLEPENINYLYNFFSDNCVTRITDKIDEVLDGQFYAQATITPVRWTLRQTIRRFMSKHPIVDLLFNFWLGQTVDRPITVKEELFLPEAAFNFISGFVYTDAEGGEQKLAGEIEVVNKALGRSPPLAAPRSNVPGFLVTGIALAALVCFIQFYLLKHRPIPVRRLLGILYSIIGLVSGITGSLLFFMEFFTNHDYTFENINVLFSNPLLLLAVPFGLMYAFGKDQKKLIMRKHILQIIMSYVFLTALITIIIKLSPAYYQDNWALLALVMPIALSLSKAPVWIRRVVSSE